MQQWTDVCCVFEYLPVKQENKTTKHEEVKVLYNEPCKLSFSTVTNARETETVSQTPQVVKVITDKDLLIRAGSKIVIKRGERTFVYASSGEPSVFMVHQEIVLVPFEKWAI